MIDQQVTRMMDAYRGNPGALVRSNQVSPDLLKLMALQRLKAEKESAMRELQLAQAPEMQGLPTVADQREQELLGMTMQQMAQQVGGVAQQKQQAEKQNLQRLLQSGIAAAPGAQAAAQPRAMAAGGIVAFNGQRGSDVQDPTARMAEMLRNGAGTVALRREFRNLSNQEFRAALEAAQEMVRAPASAAAAEPDESGAPSPARAAGPHVLSGASGVSPQGPSERPLVPDFEGASLLSSAGPVPAPAPASAPAADDPPPATYTPPPAPAMRPELRARLERELISGFTPDKSQFRTDVETGITRALKQDPMARLKELQTLHPQATAEERAADAAAMARRRAMMAEQFDPRRQGIEQLLRMGAAFSQGLTPGLAAGRTAEAGLNYTAQQREARRAMEEGILAAEGAQRAADLTGRREAYKTGIEAGYKPSIESQRAATTSGAYMTGQDRAAESARLQAAGNLLANAQATGASIYGAQIQADVSRLNNEASNLERRIQTEQLSNDRLMAERVRLSNQAAEVTRKVAQDLRDTLEKVPSTQNRAMLDALNNPNTPERQQLVRAFNNQIRTVAGAALGETTRVLQLLDQKLGMGGGGAAAEDPQAAARAELARRQRIAAGLQ